MDIFDDSLFARCAHLNPPHADSEIPGAHFTFFSFKVRFVPEKDKNGREEGMGIVSLVQNNENIFFENIFCIL